MTDTATLEKPKPAAKAGAPEVRIDRDDLLRAIRAVGQVVETRNTIPVVSNLLLRASDGCLRVTGTDLDILFEVEAPCVVDGVFETTANASRLVSAIDTMLPGEAVMTSRDGFLHIKRGGANRKLATIPADQFPVIQSGTVVSAFEMAAKDLGALLAAAQVAMSTEETRYYLCGVFLHHRDKTLIGAATDGHRLVQVRGDLPEGASGMPDSIVGRKSVSLLVKLLGDASSDARVGVKLTKSQIEVIVGRTRLLAKLVEATYPDYQRTIPRDNKKRLEVRSSELMRGVRAAAAMISLKSRGVKFELGEECRVIGSSAEGGIAVEPIAANWTAGAFEIGINSAYAASIIQTFGESADIHVDFSDAIAPILFTSPDKPAITAVVMPMRT